MHRVYLVPHDAPSVGEPTKGVRDVLSAARPVGNESESMTADSGRGTFWSQLPRLPVDTSVSCLLLTAVHTNVHITFPIPFTPATLSDLAFRNAPWSPMACVRYRTSGLTMAPHPSVTRDARTVEVTLFQTWFW